MAEKKKLSVAEILAAARKADGGGGQESAAPEEKPAAEPAAEAESANEAAEAPAEETTAAPAKKLKPGERPAISDILAMARGEKKAGAKPAAKKPAAEKKPAAKPAAEKPKPAEKKPAAEKPAAAGPRTTSSILEAARAEKRRGPMSKEEAQAKGAPTGKKAAEDKPLKAKARPTVPAMPAKPDYAKKPASKGKGASGRGGAAEERRGFLKMASLMVGTSLGAGFSALAGTLGLWSLGTARFMFPNILTEPPSNFKIGFPGDFPPDVVVTKFKSQFGVWVVNGVYNGERMIYALSTVCTHLGCTPNWLEAEQKFKCPCHGSGFYADGINFEGPAPRPLERYAIRLADDGQLEVDKSRTFQEEKGQWADSESYVPV